VKRAVSFSSNLEHVHFFDPSQGYKKGRGSSVDFRITSHVKRAGSATRPSWFPYKSPSPAKKAHAINLTQINSRVRGSLDLADFEKSLLEKKCSEEKEKEEEEKKERIETSPESKPAQI